MTKRIFCAALSLVLASLILVSCEKKEDSQNASSDSTNPTVIEEVTNENGETVTDEAGEVVTKVYEQIPVVDENGKVIKDAKGEVVTQKVPVTEAEKDKNAGVDSGNTTKKQSGSPAATKPSSGKITTKPSSGSGSTTKPSGVGSATTTKPSEKPTESTTEKPTQKPTEPTTERAENIDYFVSYAINYGTEKLGLTYRSDFGNASWDNPITMKNPIVGDDIEYYEGRIRSRLENIKKEGNGYFFVKKENRNGSADRYNFYIGY